MLAQNHWNSAATKKFALTFGVLEVVAPQRTDFVLAAHVPHGEGDALDGRHGLHIEADGWNGAHILVQLHLVQDRRLSCKVKEIVRGSIGDTI